MKGKRIQPSTEREKGRVFISILYRSALCIIPILLYACGSGSNSSYDTPSETGSITFGVECEGAPQQSSGRYTTALDCDAAGVATVVAEVYDESSLYLTSGGPWLCSAHTGTVQNVPIGLDRTVVVLGKDINGDVLYRGEQSGITVTAGETTDAGTIIVELFNPVLNPPVLISPTNEETVTSGSFSFQWNLSTGASEYQIQVSEDINFTSTLIDETVTTTYHTPTTTLSAGTFYWRVRAEDSYGNQSAWSEVWSFIVATEPGTAPSAPSLSRALAEDEQITIIWGSVYKATSYNVYWSTSSGVSKTDYEGVISNITQTSYTHTLLTNYTIYYYVVTAENSYGESDESEEGSAVPLVAWTLLKLPDTGQPQSYTDIFGEDSDYSMNPLSYTDNGEGTVTDNVTGLMWQQEDDDTTRIWEDAVNYCNDLTLADYSDWRLPSAIELVSIVDYDPNSSPSIDTTYFPGTNSYYWTSAADEGGLSIAMHVFFGTSYGPLDSSYHRKKHYVRCVRGGSVMARDFTDNGDGTVTDNNTSLMWQQGEAGEKTWEDAITYCEGLSLAEYTDWRLPNFKELRSIIDDSLYQPPIDTNYFPDAALFYWTSTATGHLDSSHACCVYCSAVTLCPRSSTRYVRCVRGGQ